MPKATKKKTKVLGSVDPSLLSVIVPAYNCKSIFNDLSTIKLYLDLLNRPYEIICVVDGLKNNKDKTGDLAKSFKAKGSRVYFYPINKGKGYAVRFGMARAKGGIIAFIDAGSDLHAKGIGLALEHMKWYDADIIIGSKRHHASKVDYPWQRKALSYIVQRVTRLFFGLNVSDTQTGLKVFRREVLVKVLPRLIVKRWAFDLEILTVANRLGFKRIYESPIEITHNFMSNVGMSSVQNFAMEYLAILYRTYILRYYDDGGSDQWQDDPNLKLRYH
ncbi:MAG: Glycosyl transferase, family 2 [Candidatus Collierbacteria bacterium GW2011_GWC2_44_18]|uniref:Glycosyl transferase, family 2 n=2 Tax=Microgenomates group TaxID=1794810 RepID=A0A0G1J8M9_9BACT|nr:MAG: Glycosyl transferase, family 2 [Microgenomates group bacterium GW2011_GWC1_44_10]KKT49322.1 MAG: Glycosyl transferase, family 2 [Candidatus Collierbacteria bacterium GW2011_GWC2_44_18]KKT67600.1 MAG: Glycosyl transferase, family 2 [Candidatus Woesebacteria bacterium GW2011_GWA2_44_33]